MLKDIKRIMAELTDKMSIKYIEITDLSSRYKYTAFSVSLYALLMWLIYTAKLFSYKAKNLKNTVNYKND